MAVPEPQVVVVIEEGLSDASKPTSPDETSAMVIGDGILRVKQFFLEQVKVVIIQRELDFEGS